MITGIVTIDRQAIIRLTVLGASGRRRSVEALIDTGFDGFLSLPSSAIEALKLNWRDRRFAILADGSETVFDVYRGVVDWDGRRRSVSIHEADAVPLVGMALLNGYELNVRVRRQGRVVIKRLKA